MGFFAKALGAVAAIAVLVGLAVIVGAYFSKGVEPSVGQSLSSPVVTQENGSGTREGDAARPKDGEKIVITVDAPETGWPAISWDEQSAKLEERAELWNFERNIDEYVAPESRKRLLPDTLNVLLTETVDYRLDSIDLDSLPREVAFAIWPDSKLSVVDRDFYLINPPSNIMELYYLQAVVEDEYDFYYEAMQRAQGMYVRGDPKLLSDQPVGQLFVQSMAEQGKAVILEPSELSAAVQSKIIAENLEFAQIDVVLPNEGMKEAWQELLQSAQHGEEINVLVEARGNSVEEFKQLLASLASQETIDAVDQ